MLIDLIYGVPTWLMALAVIAIIIGLSLLGLVVVDRLLPIELRRHHNEFVGFISALIGLFFAVLLAFIAVAAWDAFNKATATAEQEAAVTGDLFRDSISLPDAVKTPLLGELRDYVTIVLTKEWPTMAAGAPVGDEGWQPLWDFHQTLTGFETTDPRQLTITSEMLTRLNNLYDLRRSRLLAAEGHLEPTVWAVALLGAAITIAFTYLFGMPSRKLHMLMTGFVAATLALIIVLVLAFDYPFRGEVQVKPDGFRRVEHNMERAGISFDRVAERRAE